MNTEQDIWVLILAAGDGSRLRSLTTVGGEAPIPKQFCSLRGGPSLLQEALDRAQAVTSTKCISAVVSAQQEHWWRPQLVRLPPKNIIVQPLNKGTGNGVLLPLLHLLERDPAARVVLLPADHHVGDEAVLSSSIRQALRLGCRGSDEVVLLGLDPEQADAQLGYIIPGEPTASGMHCVAEFIEKPSLDEAYALMCRGALWNAFIVAASARALLALFIRRAPELVLSMKMAVRRDLTSNGADHAVARLYGQLPTLDFSRDILSAQASCLRVIRVPHCGWTDLGTPERVARVLQAAPARRPEGTRQGSEYLNLAVQHEHLRSRSADVIATVL